MTGSPDFQRCLAVVLPLEGGYVNHPADPGGETKYGISKRAYPHLDIRALTPTAAGDLYWRDYWLPAGCDRLAWPRCLIHFDAAVNHGVPRAKRFLAVSPTVKDYAEAREAFYRALVVRRPASAVFLPGWLRRIRHILEASLAP